MKIVRAILSVGLVASGLLGVQILVNDRWLWAAAPSHAYGLLVFVVIDLVLTLAVLKGIDFAPVCAALMASVQFAAMLADIVAGQPVDVPSVAFRSYLLNDTSYVGLLAIQIGILTVVVGRLAILLARGRGHWAQFFHHQNG